MAKGRVEPPTLLFSVRGGLSQNVLGGSLRAHDLLDRHERGLPGPDVVYSSTMDQYPSSPMRPDVDTEDYIARGEPIPLV